MNTQLHYLLEQYRNLTGRGNMIAANQVMCSIIERLTELYRPCQCACATPLPPLTRSVEPGPAPEAIDDPAMLTEPLAEPPLAGPTVIVEPMKPRRGRPRKIRP